MSGPTDLKVGSRVCLEPLECRHYATRDCADGTVVKVGRKYLHVRPDGCRFESRFDRLTGEGVGENGMSAGWRLHVSRQAFEEDREFDRLLRQAGNILAWQNRFRLKKTLPLERMREIVLELEKALARENGA